MNQEFQFLMYRAADKNVSVNAVIKDETIWLTQITFTVAAEGPRKARLEHDGIVINGEPYPLLRIYLPRHQGAGRKK